MKVITGIMLLVTSIVLLSGCDTTGSTAPGMQSVQPTQQDITRQRMSNAIQSTGL